jgi:malic enzyme
MSIAADASKAFLLTIKRNTVAVVTDGTAVLGLGDIGSYSAIPVIEGKAMLFKKFAATKKSWMRCARELYARRSTRELPDVFLRTSDSAF